ncbi:universal stress protein [Aquimarina rhabdastrellae]
MKNILVPLGSSDKAISTSQLQYAIDFAKALGATIYAVRIFKELPRAGSLPDVNKVLREISINTIEQEFEGLDRKGVTIISHPLEGDLLDAISTFSLKMSIDLIALSPQHEDIKDPYFLGEISGNIVKKMNFPVLVIPDNYEFKPIQRVLMAVKSGAIRKPNSLNPIKKILKAFGAEMRLLQVKTASFLPEDTQFGKELGEITSLYKSTENATVFHGVLEHLKENNPDMLCVFRRKRGFFAKLWEDNTIKKVDFESRIPLLVLKGKGIAE